MSVVQASSQLQWLVSRFLCCLASGFADRCGVLEGPCLVVVSFLGFLAGLKTFAYSVVLGCGTIKDWEVGPWFSGIKEFSRGR